MLDKTEFSEGERNFLSILGVLQFHNPWLLILDESIDCLDLGKVIKILDFLKKYYKSVIITSHKYELSQYFDKTVDLNKVH
ncbi:MAG: hypothetical protein KC414_08515 [Romboutsia sp.]|nr:hypothetical protein [Romboutsia sp.]